MSDIQTTVENSQKGLQIKGIHDGLLVTLSEDSWEKSRVLLLEKIESEQAFFKGAHIALELGNLDLRAAELGNLRDRLSDFEVTLWAVLSTSDTTNQTARMLGIETTVRKSQSKKTQEVPEKSNLEGESAVFIRRTLRAGYRIETRNPVIVLGDVNPGAEIISAGSIIVWGKCYGSVFAGIEGDRQAIICALELKPTQMRISELIASPVQRKGKPSPEMASIQDGNIVIESWNSKKH